MIVIFISMNLVLIMMVYLFLITNQIYAFIFDTYKKATNLSYISFHEKNKLHHQAMVC